VLLALLLFAVGMPATVRWCSSHRRCIQAYLPRKLDGRNVLYFWRCFSSSVLLKFLSNCAILRVAQHLCPRSTALSSYLGVCIAFAEQFMCVLQITMLLAYASKKLSHYNVLVKNLHGMDTLGAITLLASDKTGTLTMNVMVSSAYYIVRVSSALRKAPG
jgi:hypothetical protein